MKKKNEAQDIQNDQWLFIKYLIEVKRAEFLSSQPDKRKGDINLQQASDALNNYHLAVKLRYLCYIKNRERTVSYSYRQNSFDNVTDLLKIKTDVHFLISLWHKTLLLLDNPASIHHYNDLKAFLKKCKGKISSEDTRQIYTYLENSVNSVFKTKFELSQEVFSLYKIQLEEEVIYYDGFLIPAAFKNIVTVGLYLEKLEWVETFLKTHKDRISPSYEKEEKVYYLCLSMLLFEEKKFEDALDNLNKSKTTNIYLKLEFRKMQVKIYFELAYFSLLEDTINSFRKFLSENRAQIAEVYVEAYRNFINIVSKIPSSINKKTKKSKLLEEITKQNGHLPEKKWLLEKIDT